MSALEQIQAEFTRLEMDADAQGVRRAIWPIRKEDKIVIMCGSDMIEFKESLGEEFLFSLTRLRKEAYPTPQEFWYYLSQLHSHITFYASVAQLARAPAL